MEKTKLTDSEYLARRIQLTDDLQIQRSETHSDVEVVQERRLLHPDDEFRLQCSCGAIHQFSYTETPEGLRLLRVK